MAIAGMVEVNAFPATGVVATCTVEAVTTVVYILRRVTGCARGTRLLLVRVRLVTTPAASLPVPSVEWIFRIAIVVENN